MLFWLSLNIGQNARYENKKKTVLVVSNPCALHVHPMIDMYSYVVNNYISWVKLFIKKLSLIDSKNVLLFIEPEGALLRLQ
jgi:hypothetical protein